jgi:hypothetical protein
MERAALSNTFKALEEKMKAEMEQQIQAALSSAHVEKQKRQELEQNFQRERDILEQVQKEQLQIAGRLAETEADLMKAKLIAAEEKSNREELERQYAAEKEQIEQEFEQQSRAIHEQSMLALEEANRKLAAEQQRAREEQEKRAAGEAMLHQYEMELEAEKANSIAQINDLAEEKMRLANEKAELEMHRTSSQMEIEAIRRKLEEEREIIEIERAIQQEQAAMQALSKLESLTGQLEMAEQLEAQRKADELAAVANVERIKEESRQAEEALKRSAEEKMAEFERTLAVQRAAMESEEHNRQSLDVIAQMQLNHLSSLRDTEAQILLQLFPEMHKKESSSESDDEEVASQGSLLFNKKQSLNPFTDFNDDMPAPTDPSLDHIFDHRAQLQDLFEIAHNQTYIESKKRYEAELELERERLRIIELNRSKDEEIHQLERENEALQRRVRSSQRGARLEPKFRPSPLSPQSPSMGMEGHGMPFRFGSGRIGVRMLPQPVQPVQPVQARPIRMREIVPADEAPAAPTELDAAQRFALAKVTLHRVTHDPSFNFSDINLLLLTQDLMYPLPVPPDIAIDRSFAAGFLSKKGDIRRNWKRRWFVFSLTDLSLAYFTSDSEKTAKGVLNLKSVLKVFQPDLFEVKNKFGFYIVTPERTYQIRAESDLGAKAWVHMLAPLALEATV